jgi:dihydrofolate reductase
MRKVVLMMSVSIDGLVAGPHGHAGGVAEPDELKRWKLDRVRRAGTHIMGRVTYEEMAVHWPTSDDDYAAPMNEIPKVVFSKTLDEATWAGSSIARGDLGDEIATLRRQPGGEIIAWGGASFAQSLSRAGLINEYVLVIHPVAFGSGLRMFRDLPKALQLKLLEAQTFNNGTVLHIYEPSDRAEQPGG